MMFIQEEEKSLLLDRIKHGLFFRRYIIIDLSAGFECGLLRLLWQFTCRESQNHKQYKFADLEQILHVNLTMSSTLTD